MILTPEQCTPQVEVSGCFLCVSNEFLLLKRADSGEWSVPAGKAEDGEHKVDTLCRELTEETGILVVQANVTFFKTYYLRHGGKDLLYHLFIISLDAKPDVSLSEEHTASKWVTPKEALSLHLIEDEDICINDYFDKE